MGCVLILAFKAWGYLGKKIVTAVLREKRGREEEERREEKERQTRTEKRDRGGRETEEMGGARKEYGEGRRSKKQTHFLATLNAFLVFQATHGQDPG